MSAVRSDVTAKLDEMVQGYMDGIDWTSIYEPSWLARKSVSYIHGFKNGMDDRQGNPREKADVLRRRAAMILGESP